MKPYTDPITLLIDVGAAIREARSQMGQMTNLSLAYESANSFRLVWDRTEERIRCLPCEPYGYPNTWPIRPVSRYDLAMLRAEQVKCGFVRKEWRSLIDRVLNAMEARSLIKGVWLALEVQP